MLKVSTLLLVVCLAGCADKYQEGYSAGYAAGEAAARAREIARCDERQRELERQSALDESTSTHVTTEVCGGGGININGRHVPGGKTGCVRVFSDGRVQRY
jgi:hypothetical protein